MSHLTLKDTLRRLRGAGGVVLDAVMESLLKVRECAAALSRRGALAVLPVRRS